jgi:hypothetical protein
MPDKKAMLNAARGYLREHPEELLRIVRNAAGLRIGLPIAALRWFAGQVKGKRAPRDVELGAAPPGIRAAATVDLMGTSVRASAVLYVDAVHLTPDELRLELRLADVALVLLDATADSPVAALIKSGALDLSKPGNLVNFMPKRPAMLVEAKDDRIVLDLKRHPKLTQNGRAERLVGLVTPIVNVRAVESDREHLDIVLKVFPQGLATALATIRAYL